MTKFKTPKPLNTLLNKKFESLLGKKYNSDVNGSLNIGRKYLTTINKYTIEMHNKLLFMMGNPRVRTV